MNTIREVMKSKVDNLELSVRCSNCMKRAGIRTMEDLTKSNIEILKNTKNFGKKSFEELTEKLTAMGLSFDMTENDWAGWGLSHLNLIKNLQWEMVR